MVGGLFDNETVVRIAEKHQKTPAQILLRWHIQDGVIVIPKSTKEKRIIENGDVFDFELSAEDMAAISALNQDHRTGPDPDNFDF